MYEELIQKDTDAPTRGKRNNIKKHNIVDVLNNVGAVFAGNYFHYKNLLKETMFERSIEERLKLRKERMTEIKEKNKTKAIKCLIITLVTIETQVVSAKD